MPVTSGTPFEEYVWSNWWLRNFPTNDWSSDQQVSLAGGYKVAYCGNKRAIGDAKDKARLTVQDGEKVIEAGGIYRARWLYLIIAADTRISCSIREYTDDYGVEIVRTWWRA